MVINKFPKDKKLADAQRHLQDTCKSHSHKSS